MSRRTYWLLYDGDCRICTATARWAKALDGVGRIRIRPIQESREFLADVPQDRILDAYHMIAPDGRVTTGGDAVPTMIEAFPLGSGLAKLLRGSEALMNSLRRLYRFAAGLRDALICRVPSASREAESLRGGTAGP